MECPSEIRDIVKQAVDRCKSRQAAVRHAAKNIKAHPSYETFVECLVYGAVETLVGDARSTMNRQMREYVAAPKVDVLGSPAVQAIHDRFMYRIGGNVLGNMTKEDLQVVTASEGAGAATKAFNARLTGRLVPLVPTGKRVQEVVSKKKLDSIWDGAEGGQDKAA